MDTDILINCDMTDNLKAQAREQYAPSNEASIYKFVGVNGGGELLHLTKLSVISKNFNEIDMFCTVNERNVQGVNKCVNWTLNQLEIIKLILSRLYSKKIIG